MKIVELSAVSRVYKVGDHEQRALDNVDLALERGKLIVILGPSGAGKSTMLNLLGGLDSPTSGKITVDGKDISHLSADQLAEYRAEKVGFVFQSYNLIPTLTVYENVALVREIARNALEPEKMLASVGLAVGDSFTFSPFGTSESYTARVSGIVRSLSESIVLSEESAESLGLSYRINTLYSKETEIEPSESILNTQTKKSIIDSFDTFMKIMTVMIWLLIVAAAVLGVVVLYDLGVMSYTERYREMATLKVIGFKDRKIGKLLIGQNMLLTVAGIIIGIPAALGVLKFLVSNLAKEYELRISVSTLSFIISIALVFGVSLAAGLMIARKNKKIDMVEALKAQE